MIATSSVVHGCLLSMARPVELLLRGTPCRAIMSLLQECVSGFGAVPFLGIPFCPFLLHPKEGSSAVDVTLSPQFLCMLHERSMWVCCSVCPSLCLCAMSSLLTQPPSQPGMFFPTYLNLKCFMAPLILFWFLPSPPCSCSVTTVDPVSCRPGWP